MRLDQVLKFNGTLLIHLLRLFPINKRKILFVSFFGAGYEGSGKKIVQALLSKAKDLDIVWAANPLEFDDRRRTFPCKIKF